MNLRKSLARINVVVAVRDAMPSLGADSLRMLDDESFVLARVAERWACAGEPMSHVAGLCAAGRTYGQRTDAKHAGHGGGDTDHVDACARALDAAMRRASDAFSSD